MDLTGDKSIWNEDLGQYTLITETYLNIKMSCFKRKSWFNVPKWTLNEDIH